MERSMQRYWKTNKTYMILLLTLWGAGFLKHNDRGRATALLVGSAT